MKRAPGNPPGVRLDVGRIRQILIDRDLGVTEFAQLSGVPRTSIWPILSRGKCSPRMAGRLARGLGLKGEDIIADDPEPEALASLDAN